MSARRPELLATAWRLHLPGVAVGATVAGRLGRPPGAWAEEVAVPAERSATLLGRKGLLSKEPATRLALCAVHRALGMAPAQRPDWPLDPDTAVVVAGNLGNVGSVARVTGTVADEGARAVSVLDAPNVSSNVVASTVALWFRFGGPNLMVCSGADAGLDALELAGLLLRAGRATRVVLVGAEADDEVAMAVHDARPDAPPLRAGAACVVLRAAHPDALPAAGEAVIRTATAARPALVVARDHLDTTGHWGDHYGAQGVVDLALAAHLAVDEDHGPIAVHGAGDPSRTVLVSSVRRAS